MTTLKNLPSSYYIAWAMALLATAASVVFIEILKNPVAWLCWFERMLIFGLLLVLSVGLFTKDLDVWKYVLPFVVFGLPAAAYQQLIHWGVIAVESQSCTVGFVCTTKYFEIFGFITQATLCFTAFAVIAACMWHVKKRSSVELWDSK